MDTNGANIDKIVQLIQSEANISLNPSSNGSNRQEKLGINIENDLACTSIPDIFNKLAGIDMTMDKIANFQNIIFSAQDSLMLMSECAEKVNSLTLAAQKDEVNGEETEKLQEEVKRKVEEIKSIKAFAEFDGINPFEEDISIEISNWQDVLGISGKSVNYAKEELAELLNSSDFDVRMNNGNFQIGEDGVISLSYTKHGEFQITVNSAFGDDFSFADEFDVRNENAPETVGNFIEAIVKYRDNMELASNFIGSFFTDTFPVGSGEDLPVKSQESDNYDSSKSLQEQIIQNPELTIANTTYITPGITVEML